MKNHEIFRLREGLNDVSNVKGVKFAYVVLKNKKILDDEIEFLQKTIVPTPEFDEYERQRVSICEMFSNKDKDGRPIVENNAYSLNEELKPNFEKSMDELKEQYFDAVETRKKQIDEYNGMMQEETNIATKLLKVKFEQLPEDLSAEQLEKIAEIIED